MLYRMACRCDDSVSEWSINKNIAHDTSGKNKSALTAALVRAVKAEIAVVLDVVVGGAFIDYEPGTQAQIKDHIIQFPKEFVEAAMSVLKQFVPSRACRQGSHGKLPQQ